MSKERELLKVAVITLEDAHFNSERDQAVHLRASVIKQLKDALAQPEQTKQEPMAWVWGVFNPHTGDWCDGCVAKDKPLENQDRRNIRALYTTPPRREPLSDEEVSLGRENGYDDRFVDGVLFAEKMHGITGGGE